jgi:hypothetical protein
VVFPSESEDGITQMFQVLDRFVAWSRMEINVSKCATASYIYDENRRQTYRDGSFQFRGEMIANLTTAESMKYLGVPIVAPRTATPKSAKGQRKERKVLLVKIMSSPVLTMQKIDAVETLLFPSIDFLLMNREAGGIQLSIVHKNIRGMVNKALKIKRLPIECHHASLRDGGLSYLRLRGRGDALAIR